jgi:hypothetical protein
VGKDKIIFLENPQGEIDAAKNAFSVLDGRVFSDERFVNNLVLRGYYKVTGAGDDDPILIGLFYTRDKDLFLKSIDSLKNKGIKYIATTKRMREKYILMLDYPKTRLINSDLYEENLNKIYDNGDVRIYDTKTTETIINN